MAGTFQNTVTIATGASVSPGIACGNLALVGIKCPTLTSTNMTLNVSTDNGATYQQMFLDNSNNQANSAYLILPANNTGNIYVALNPDFTLGVDYCQLAINGTQGSAQTFGLHFREKR